MKTFFKFLGFKGSTVFILCLIFSIVAVQNLSQAVSLSFLLWDIAAFSVLELMFICLFTGITIGLLLAWRKKKREAKVDLTES